MLRVAGGTDSPGGLATERGLTSCRTGEKSPHCPGSVMLTCGTPVSGARGFDMHYRSDMF